MEHNKLVDPEQVKEVCKSELNNLSNKEIDYIFWRFDIEYYLCLMTSFLWSLISIYFYKMILSDQCYFSKSLFPFGYYSTLITSIEPLITLFVWEANPYSKFYSSKQILFDYHLLSGDNCSLSSFIITNDN